MDARYLVHLSFTSTSRLIKPTHYFSYKGHEFKITRTRQKAYADNLLAIVDQEPEVDEVARVAAEYFSALAWANGGDISFGTPTWLRNGRINDLKSARACMFEFHKIPPGRSVGGHSISVIPHIETAEQRLALALYREAGASNNDYLAFLFLWHILDIDTGGAIGAANKARKQIKDSSYVDRLILKGKSIGNYFESDCRHAIAHIVRRPGETTLDFDSPQDRARIALSVRAVKVFAKHHIENRLGLTKKLYLYRTARGAIPEYLPAGAKPGRLVQPDRVQLTTAIT